MKVFLEDGVIFQEPNAGDAGYDLRSKVDMVLPANQVLSKFSPKTGVSKLEVGILTIEVPTGVYLEIPSGYVGIVKDKSSRGLQSLKVNAGVIDSTFRGEIIIEIANHSTKDIMIMRGEKVAQLLIVPCITPVIEVVENLSDLTETLRGKQGFGSTGLI